MAEEVSEDEAIIEQLKTEIDYQHERKHITAD
jgi:hypothetical protein